MRRIVSAWALVALFAFTVFAQKGPCKAEFIKAESSKPGPPTRTNDFYLFSTILEKPVVGEVEQPARDEGVFGKL